MFLLDSVCVHRPRCAFSIQAVNQRGMLVSFSFFSLLESFQKTPFSPTDCLVSFQGRPSDRRGQPPPRQNSKLDYKSRLNRLVFAEFHFVRSKTLIQTGVHDRPRCPRPAEEHGEPRLRGLLRVLPGVQHQHSARRFSMDQIRPIGLEWIESGTKIRFKTSCRNAECMLIAKQLKLAKHILKCSWSGRTSLN